MRHFFGFVFVAALAACSSGEPPSLPYMEGDAAVRVLAGTGAGKIEHVVYVIQENRSFNSMFEGFPNAHTVSSGKNSQGKTVQLQPISLKKLYDIDHSAGAMFEACNAPAGDLPGTHCRMNGFDRELASYGGPPDPQYVYVDHKESKPYFDMAHHWVLADRMFASQLDESFVAHQYIIAAQAKSSVNVPDGPWGCPGGSRDEVLTITHDRQIGPGQTPCFNYTTLGDELDNAGLSWRFYTSTFNYPTSGLWSGYQAIDHIYNGPDWKKDVITPQKRFLTDVGKGKLAKFTWITPLCPDSDHVACGGGYGPSWVATVVNAVGESKFWKSTVIFVQWDDWGGLYDSVPPPYRDYDSLGFRVPLMVISPYAKHDYVSHVQYETASVLKFAEDLFGLPPLAAADRRARSPAADTLDFTQAPRKFVPITSPKGLKFFLHQDDDGQAPDYE